VNGSDVAVHPACGPYDCDGLPLVRLDALQEDGEWIERGDFTRYDDGLTGDSWVSPDGVLELGSMWRLADSPGTFRQAVRVADEGGVVYEVSREVAVVGWSEDTLAGARDILRRADEAECTFLRRIMMSTLTTRLEPDALLDLERDARDFEAKGILLEMVRRGTFVHELVPRLTLAPMDDVRDAAEIVRTRGQDPVRRVLATRFLELVADHEATPSYEDYYTITELEDVWPEDAPAVLVERLGEGHDEGSDLEQLVDTLRYVDRDRFAPYTRTLLRALDVRCAGATGELRQSCDLTIEHFTAQFPSLGGRGFGSSSHCGGAMHRASSVCEALREEWNTLEAEAGDLTVHELGGGVSVVE
jgi:hypothetical protein